MRWICPNLARSLGQDGPNLTAAGALSARPADAEKGRGFATVLSWFIGEEKIGKTPLIRSPIPQICRYMITVLEGVVESHPASAVEVVAASAVSAQFPAQS